MAFILVIDSEEAFHQSGLAGAVFSHQGVDRARLHLQRNVIQGLDAGKGFCDIRHSQEDILCHRCFPPFCC